MKYVLKKQLTKIFMMALNWKNIDSSAVRVNMVKISYIYMWYALYLWADILQNSDVSLPVARVWPKCCTTPQQ